MDLEKESTYFAAKLSGYLSAYEGKFALVKDQECHGFFDTPDSAYERGIELFGAEPFLIRQVLAEYPPDDSPAMLLGLIHASV